MKIFSFSLRSKRPTPSPLVKPCAGERSAEKLYEISEFGELSWYSRTPPERNLPADEKTVTRLHTARVAPSSGFDGAYVPPDIQDPSVDTLPAKAQTAAILVPPSLSSTVSTSSGEYCSQSYHGSCTSGSSPSVYSTLRCHSASSSNLLRKDLQALDLSTRSLTFPSVPPLSDEMIDALTTDLEQDYQRTRHAREVVSMYSTTSSASTSFSDLFEASSQTSADTECTTPDSEWSPQDDDLCSLPHQPASLDAEKFTVRLVSPPTSSKPDCLPMLKKWTTSRAKGAQVICP